MRNSIIRGALLGILLLGFTIPGTALAGGGGKGCSNIGTWFGVYGIGDTRLTGWMATVTGKSSNEGTNNLEYPNFDYTLGGQFPTAVGISSLRGTWVRTGGNTFDYTFMGYAVAEPKQVEIPMPGDTTVTVTVIDTVYIAKVSGHVTLFENCQYEHTTATMEIFLPHESPFGEPTLPPIQLADHYGYRATVDLPY